LTIAATGISDPRNYGGLMRYLLSPSARRRWRHALVLLGVIAVAVGAFSGSASARPPAEGPEGLPEDYVAEPQFFQGDMLEHLGCHFDAVRGNYVGRVMLSDVWYGNRDGQRVTPRVGEVWLGVAHVGLFNPCGGNLAVEFVVKPPPHTTFAISARNRIRCGLIPQGGIDFIDMTGDPSCPMGAIPTAEGFSLGTRFLPSYSQFAVQFPLTSTAPLKGAAGPNGGDKLSVKVTPDNANTQEPFVHVNVEQPPQPVPIAQEQTTLSPGAFLNCLWDNPNNPGPC
jgi:hypothetical protein